MVTSLSSSRLYHLSLFLPTNRYAFTNWIVKEIIGLYYVRITDHEIFSRFNSKWKVMKKCIEETSKGYQCFGAGANPFCRSYGQTRQKAGAGDIFTLSQPKCPEPTNMPPLRLKLRIAEGGGAPVLRPPSWNVLFWISQKFLISINICLPHQSRRPLFEFLCTPLSSLVTLLTAP